MITKRKNLDLTPHTVKVLTKAAIDNNTVFKHFAEKLLEDAAKNIKSKKDETE